MTLRKSSVLLLALGVCVACGDDDAGLPPITSYGVRLTGATGDHGAATLTLRNLPGTTTFTAAAGIVLHTRKSADGQTFSLFVAGDLTRSPLLTFTMPRAANQLGVVTEMARQDGALVTGGLPLVAITAQ